MATERTEEQTRRPRPISELQRDAAGIVEQARAEGEVPIRRYGDIVAYLVSPEERRRAHFFEELAERAVVAEDYRRGMEDFENGRVVEWEVVKAQLQAVIDGARRNDEP